MAIRNPRDFWSGVLFTLLGVGALVIGSKYTLGTAARMGPGYFPRILGILLIVLGVVSALFFGRTVSAAAGAPASSVYSSRARFVAVATIVLWLMIIFLGRSIAYDVEIWESWHLA